MFLWQPCWNFVSGDSVLFGRGWDSQLQQFDLCLMFLSLTNYHLTWGIWSGKECPRQQPKMFMIVQMTRVSYSREPQNCRRPFTTSIVSIFCRWTLLSGVSQLPPGLFSDSYHHNRGRRAGLKELLYYCFKSTSYTYLHTAIAAEVDSVSDVSPSSDIDCTQSLRYIIKHHLLCPVNNERYNWLYTWQRRNSGDFYGNHVLVHCCLLCIRPCLAVTLKGISVLGPPFDKEK